MRLNLQTPETERAALAGGPIRKQNALATLAITATERPALQEIQAQRIERRFLLPPDVAATIARLHFGEARGA
jgi:hypothetical protein